MRAGHKNTVTGRHGADMDLLIPFLAGVLAYLLFRHWLNSRER
ncbi:hypothetical protein ACUSIJ_06200 [Pseudochelatococcus sp. B33]